MLNQPFNSHQLYAPEEKLMTEENYRVGLVPLAFDIARSGTQLVGASIIDYEALIAKVMESKQFQDALKEAARAHWDRTFIGAVGGSHRSAEENEKAKAEAIKNAMLSSGGSEALKLAMASPKGQELKRNLSAFKREFEASPTGVWINENKTKLIVVGVLAAVGGACYMYKNKTGDRIADLGKDLLKKTWVVGTINLETKATKLKPSAHELELQAALSHKWRSINTNVTVRMLAHKNLADIKATGIITVPLSTHLTASLGVNHSVANIPMTGSPLADSQEKNYGNLNPFVKLQYTEDKISLQLNAMLEDEGVYKVYGIIHINF
jgi:hypothetical protein